MSLLLNIHEVDANGLALQGELAVEAVGWETRDEMIRVTRPLQYDVRAQKMENSIWVQGALRQALDCECVRCLRPFVHEVILEPWHCLLALAGEERAEVVNDCVDLTPYFREDIFLAFPQHPLCGPQCKGLAQARQDVASSGWESQRASTVWSELNKLKL